MADEARIKERMDEVLNSIFCPVFGCWPLHTCQYGFYYDEHAKAHVVEVWPVAVEGIGDIAPSGHLKSESGLFFEPAEFEFSNTFQKIDVEHFHFSQRDSVFEIGWSEAGHKLELRVHILPKEDD